MKILKFASLEGWKVWRLGRVTGSRVKDIISKSGRKVESYALIAESWIGSAALAEEEESPELAMERGKRLEPEAIARFNKETGKKAVWHNDDIGWEHDDDPRIAISPDASIGVLEAVEAKCLSAKRHMEAFVTKKIPAEHNYQKLQYFVVNKKLRTLYFVFYNPLFPKGLDFFVIPVQRKDIKDEIKASYEYQVAELKWMREQIDELSKYVQPSDKPVAQEEVADAEYTLDLEHKEVSPKEGLDKVFNGIKDRAYD